jgi:hypothetical protein
MSKKKKTKKTQPTASKKGPAPGEQKQAVEAPVLVGPPAPLRKWCWLGVFVIIAALHFTTVSTELGGLIGGDNTTYYLLGRALATGQGYVDLYLPGHPPHTQYPPLFPVVLAFFELVLEKPLPAMHVTIALMSTGAFIFLGLWCGRRLGSEWMGMALALVFATMSRLYILSENLLTEPMYMLLCFLALFLAPEKKGAPLGPRTLAVLALAAVASFFTRSAGIALVAAVGLGLWRSQVKFEVRGWKVPGWAILAAVFLAPALAWYLRNSLVPTESAPYVSQFLAKDPYRLDLGRVTLADLLDRIRTNVKYFMPFLLRASYSPIWVLPLSDKVSIGISCILIPFMVGGMVRDFKDGAVTAVTFTLLSLAIILVWPFREERFALPILPLTCFYFFQGALWLLRWALKERAGRIVTAGLIALMLAVQIFTGVTLVKGCLGDGWEPREPVEVSGYGKWDQPIVNWAHYNVKYFGANDKEMAWIRRLTNYMIINRVAGDKVPEGAVILSRKPSLTYFYSGRESVPFLTDSRPERFMRYLGEQKVEYIVIGLEEKALAPVLKMWPDRFTIAVEIRGTPAKILKVELDK